MPIYEYHCPLCGAEIEEIQKFSDPPLTLCPNCGKDSLEKKISLAGFQLKGTGWYVTDFKDVDKKPVAKPTEAQSSGNESGTSTANQETSKSKESPPVAESKNSVNAETKSKTDTSTS